MRTENYLDKIVLHKELEVQVLLKHMQDNPNHPLNNNFKINNKLNRIFAAAIKKHKMTIIAEIKRKSPSRGQLNQISDPVDLALNYCQGGAAAISVLTDFANFGGTLIDLHTISQRLAQEYPSVPTLRKDFIIHQIQLVESAHTGAACVLLIARLLGKKLSTFIAEATHLGLETLVEIHNEEELKLALDANAAIIGINHRNLKTFAIDLSLSEKLRPLIPAHIITIAESGILTPADALKMHALGYDAILVGEALVTANNPADLIKKMQVLS